jgi:hypothetical protein
MARLYIPTSQAVSYGHVAEIASMGMNGSLFCQFYVSSYSLGRIPERRRIQCPTVSQHTLHPLFSSLSTFLKIIFSPY